MLDSKILENQQIISKILDAAKEVAKIDYAIKVYREDKQTINDTVKKYGISAVDFAKIVKYMSNDEIFLQDRELLEQIESLKQFETGDIS